MPTSSSTSFPMAFVEAYLIYEAYASAAALLLVAGLIGWNRALRRRVLQRTVELGETEQRFRQIAENTQDMVRQAEDRIRLVIDTIPVMAWSVRPDGIVDFLNQRWMDYAGLSLEQYVEDPTGPIHPEDIPRVMERWRAQMAIGEGYEEEMRLRRAGGGNRWVLVRTAPLRDGQGNLGKWDGASTGI